MMKVAVTGANGFLGRHVVAELAKFPVEVIAAVRKKTAAFIDNERLQFVELEIGRAGPAAIGILGHPDVLIHLAWGGLPNYHSLHHFEEELPMHYQFLKHLIASGIKSLVIAGTCFEYGMRSGPLTEIVSARPTNPYGFAKHSLHQQLLYLQKKHQYSITWLRLFYLYGSGQAENSLFSQLCKAVTRGDKVFNMSGGEQLRDYLSVREAAEKLVSLALMQSNIGVVNICSGIPISIRSLVERWLTENNWNISLNLGYYPYPDYEPMAFWGDCCKLQTCLEQQ